MTKFWLKGCADGEDFHVFVSIVLVCFFNARDSHSNPFLISGIGIEPHTTQTVFCPTKEDLANEH